MSPEAPPDDPVFVVIGGYEYSPAMNQPSTLTVRELARRYRVLNLTSEAHGSILGRFRGRAGHMDAADVARTVLGSTRPRRVEERLWIAPVRGLAAVGPVNFPEVMRRHNVRVFSEVIRAWMADVGVETCVLLFYWPLPELVETIPHVASLYDCVDDVTAFPGALVPAAVNARLEGRLLDAVDRSYVVSPALLDRRSGPRRDIAVLPNSFDLTLFERLERQGFAVPPRLRAVDRPVVGYAGGFTSRTAWELMDGLAGRRPQWNFVFVGGDPRAVPRSLRERPNVILHENVPYPAALGAISTFDVGTIPVRMGRFSRGNSFLKLLDYFAHGIPVVAPSLPDTTCVAEDHPGLIRLADDLDGWEAAVAAALEEPRDSPLRAARRAYVAERSVARRVARLVADALPERPPAPGVLAARD